jgi:hypothetical protein
MFAFSARYFRLSAAWNPPPAGGALPVVHSMLQTGGISVRRK